MHRRLARFLTRITLASLTATAIGLVGPSPLPVPSALAATPAGWGAQDLQSAYGFQAATGAGETVALVTAYDDPQAESDLAAYRSQYNIAGCTTANGCFKKVNQTGGTTYPSTTSWTDVDAQSLDAISAVCPGCNITMVEANSSSLDDLGTAANEAVTLGAKFVDTDFAIPEAEVGAGGEATYDAYFNHSGVAITAPAGDSGFGVNYPAASKFVTSVGGTVLSKTGTTYSETAWSSSGAGCSEFEAKPSWQTDAQCAGRTVNDTAAAATNVAYYNSASGGWGAGSGTAISSAIVAAGYALIAASNISLGINPAQYLYAHVSAFTDITGGSDGTCSIAYLCTAGTGYDGPTGIGSISTSSRPVSVSATPVLYDTLFSSMEIYGVTSTGVLEQDAYTTSSGWRGWTSLGNPSGVPLTGTPSAINDAATGNLEIYATGRNGSLNEIAYVPGSGWSTWKNVTGTSGVTLASSPAAFNDTLTGNIEVYATDTSGHAEQAAFTTSWSWHNLGGSVTGTPAPLHDPINNVTEVYATGTDGTLTEYAYSSGWHVSSVGGAISGSPSAMYDSVNHALEIYATGSGTSGSSVQQAGYTAANGWNWHNLGGSVTGSPSALLDTATGNPEVYATGTSGNLTGTAWTAATGWKAWGTIGSGTTITGSPVAIYDQLTAALDVYALTSGTISKISWKTSWGSWSSLGATPTFIAP